MNQLLGQGNKQAQGRSDESKVINVNVVVYLQYATENIQIQVDPDIPFNIFFNGIKEKIFAQRIQAQYEEKFICNLGNEKYIDEEEGRSIHTLGFTKNCTLFIKCFTRPNFYIGSIKNLYNVFLDLSSKSLEFKMAFQISTPLSLVFQDILLKLQEQQVFQTSSQFKLFINNTEIEPFDPRPLDLFEGTNSIYLKKIPLNTQLNQREMENYKLIESIKQYNHKFQLKTLNSIKCVVNFEQNGVKNIELIEPINTSLFQMIKHVKNDLSISKKYDQSFKYQINGLDYQNLRMIYPKGNIDIDIKILGNELKFFINGDLLQKMSLLVSINLNQEFYFEEYIPITIQHSEYFENFKCKLFGQNQFNYGQIFIKVRDELIRVSYQQLQ